MQRYLALPIVVFVSCTTVSFCSTYYMDFFFFLVLLSNEATTQLQECEKFKKLGGSLAESGVCCECVGERAVVH